MKRILALTLLAAPAAHAHTLDPAGGFVTSLSHELIGVHHLPLTLLLVAIGAALIMGFRKRSR